MTPKEELVLIAEALDNTSDDILHMIRRMNKHHQYFYRHSGALTRCKARVNQIRNRLGLPKIEWPNIND